MTDSSPPPKHRFDRSQSGIVGQEVYGSGACFDMAQVAPCNCLQTLNKSQQHAAPTSHDNPRQFL